MEEKAKKWSDYTHEERMESFAKYVKFEIGKHIKDGTKVWETPQEKNQELMPFNAITGKHYSGVNSILLESEAKKRGFTNGAWINQNQVKVLGKQGVKIKDDELKNAVKIAYIKQYETQIKKDENGKAITEPQLDKDGNPKINPKTNEPYWKYVYESVKLEKPILETAYLFHQSQCEGLEKIVTPNLSNNAIEIKDPIISNKIDLFPQTKKDIENYLKNQQEEFLKSQGVAVNRTFNEKGLVVGESLFIGDKLNGLQRTWHDNGKLKSEVNCIDGKYDGVKRTYFDDGKLQSEAHYKMDKLGVYKEYDHEGKVIKQEDYKEIRKELAENSHKELLNSIVDEKNNILFLADPHRRAEDLQSTAEITEKEFEKVIQKKGGYEFALKTLQEYKDLSNADMQPKERVEQLNKIDKKFKEFATEQKQEKKATQKRVSPQVRAEMEKKAQRQGRGR